jgi:hypothetical protein
MLLRKMLERARRGPVQQGTIDAARLNSFLAYLLARRGCPPPPSS